MKKLLLLLLFLLPVCAHAEEGTPYPWILTVYGGGASLCVDAGCFGPSGPSFGASFGRGMSARWSFELEASVATTSETEPALVDESTGIIFAPVLDRTRVWGGGAFLGSLKKFGDASDFFIALGAVGAYESRTEKAPEGVFVAPPLNVGIVGGVSAGAGFNLWFWDKWGFRPEVRYYACASSLSGVRYTVGLTHKF